MLGEEPMDWGEFETRPSYDGIWFLCVPAEPPFPCTPPEAEVWLSLELQMWEYYVLASVSDEVKPLFLDGSAGDDIRPFGAEPSEMS